MSRLKDLHAKDIERVRSRSRYDSGSSLSGSLDGARRRGKAKTTDKGKAKAASKGKAKAKSVAKGKDKAKDKAKKEVRGPVLLRLWRWAFAPLLWRISPLLLHSFALVQKGKSKTKDKAKAKGKGKATTDETGAPRFMKKMLKVSQSRARVLGSGVLCHALFTCFRHALFTCFDIPPLPPPGLPLADLRGVGGGAWPALRRGLLQGQPLPLGGRPAALHCMAQASQGQGLPLIQRYFFFSEGDG